ncbi:SDR family NAD(P)-dependent oxidoreductase [Knoellia aerolata]|uniref:Short-chain dehydrogenase n=1 Tax=Knoellia aerolata DSM 18566 TaxID=1385519 RepID=A0A0A0JZ14_9MICO|nr:SDR family NAD(P)-dependent oxidoreductase [Knoellia aerolata]KGN40786.1 short-chain dehydrogenase [Knoellia aerolata DSM 18566]
MRTTGAHVLLTGATGTIGAALARRLAVRGARVTLLARTPDALAALARSTGGTAFPADLCDPDGVEGLQGLHGLVNRVEAEQGPVDVLVNNAGAETTGFLTDLTAEDLRRTVDLNLTAPLELCRQVLPGMLARGRGHLVNVSSLAGVATFPGLAVYGGSKAGLTHATSGLRADLRGTPVGTLAVEIGPVVSEMMDRIGRHRPSEAAFDRVLRARLLTLLDPDHVAHRIVSAIEADRPHLRLPRRAAPIAAVTGAPRALARIALSGIPTRHPHPTVTRSAG